MPDVPPPLLEIREDVGVHRARPGATLGQAMADATAAIEAACAARLRFVLLDALGLDGTMPPSIAERAAMVRGWAAAADGRLHVAVVVPPAFVDPERFGIVAAAAHGLVGDVFSDTDDAWAWIVASRGAR